MNNAAWKVGWVIFIVGLTGAALRTGPDDPITAGLRPLGMYRPITCFLCAVIGLMLIRIVRMRKQIVAMRRELDQLQQKGG